MIAAVIGYSMAQAAGFLRPVAGLPARLTSGWSASCYAAALLPFLAGILVIYFAVQLGG